MFRHKHFKSVFETFNRQFQFPRNFPFSRKNHIHRPLSGKGHPVLQRPFEHPLLKTKVFCLSGGTSSSALSTFKLRHLATVLVIYRCSIFVVSLQVLPWSCICLHLIRNTWNICQDALQEFILLNVRRLIFRLNVFDLCQDCLST